MAIVERAPDASVHPADLPLIERLFSPIQRFTRTSSAGGIVLMAATVIALAWANSPWSESYHHAWESMVSVGFGALSASITLHHLINDGLMAVFFFVVGLEIKREVIAGELSSVRSAALPMVAALGGVAVPAALYALMNAGGPGAAGWGVPMATDIAFALGVLALLGDRVPVALKIFLTALAIVDDIVAVLVIAIFYTSGVSVAALTAAAVLLAVSIAANAAGVRQPWAYGVIGIALWAAVAVSGIHATVAGVLLALTIPVRTRVNEREFLARVRRAVSDFDAAAAVTARDPDVTVLSNTAHHTALEEIETLTERATPPLIRMEHALHGVVAFGIMPLFALANAGVAVAPGAAAAALADPIAMGVILGLVVGKPVGIVGFTWVAVRLGLTALPAGVTWPMIAGAGVLGGIGFTMALFIAGLAYPSADMLDVAKMAILAASAVTGVVGFLYLRAVVRPT